MTLYMIVVHGGMGVCAELELTDYITLSLQVTQSAGPGNWGRDHLMIDDPHPAPQQVTTHNPHQTWGRQLSAFINYSEGYIPYHSTLILER